MVGMGNERDVAVSAAGMATLRRMVMAELDRTTETDTLDRAQMRIRMVFDLFYDDEEGEPDQAICDLLTDLMHIAVDRKVDIEDAVRRAAEMYTMEREDWENRQ